MRALAIVALLGTPVVAEKTTANVTIDHTGDWKGGNRQPIVVHADGNTRRVAVGAVATFDAALTKTNHAIAFDVQIPGMKSFRRWGVLLPGARYRMVGNPCAFWGLNTDDKSDKPETFRIDARALPPSSFPLTLSVGEMDERVELEKPGISAAATMQVSAMCPRSGAAVTVRTGKKLIFDETLIGHPGRLHTIVLRKPTTLGKGGFEVVVE